MPIPSGPNIPSLETVMNTVRALCNDSFAGATNTPGEGQILTDQVPNTTTPNPFILNHLNSAIRELYRRLRNVGTPTLIQDNYVLLGTPVIDGTNGPGVPDPSTQEYLDNTGFFDGTAYHNSLVLPTDMLMPLRLWERANGTADTFIPMKQAPNGLEPINQVDRLVYWEWRADRLNFVGSTISRDIRIRYQGVFPQFFASTIDFSTVFIPIIDCEDAVAFLTAYRIAISLAPSVAPTLKQEAEAQIQTLRNEQVRRMQRSSYRRQSYNDGDIAAMLDEYGI